MNFTHPKYEIENHQKTLHAGHRGDGLQVFPHDVVFGEDNFRGMAFL